MKKVFTWLLIVTMIGGSICFSAFAQNQSAVFFQDSYINLTDKELGQAILNMTETEVNNIYNALSKNELHSIIEKLDTEDNYTCVETFTLDDSVFFKELDTVPVEKLINESTHIKSSSATITGKFSTNKIKTNVLGFKVRLSFSWEAISNSNGAYELTKVNNTTAKYYCNYILLYLTWNTYYYQHKNIVRSYNKKKANFTINYSFSGTRKGETTLTELNMSTNISCTIKELLNG